MKRFILFGLLLVLVVGVSVVSAQPENPECWGEITSEAASYEPGLLGEHSSEFAGEERDGLGNLVSDLGLDHISDLGTILGEVDGIPTTSCPD